MISCAISETGIIEKPCSSERCNDEAGLESRFIVNETASFRSSIQWVHDYEKPLKIGFLGIKREAEERLAALDPFSPVDQTEKKPFLEAVILTADAIMLWAKRHSALAAEKAAAETDPVRKAELTETARICAKVPAEPAAARRSPIFSPPTRSRIISRRGTRAFTHSLRMRQPRCTRARRTASGQLSGSARSRSGCGRISPRAIRGAISTSMKQCSARPHPPQPPPTAPQG